MTLPSTFIGNKIVQMLVQMTIYYISVHNCDSIIYSCKPLPVQYHYLQTCMITQKFILIIYSLHYIAIFNPSIHYFNSFITLYIIHSYTIITPILLYKTKLTALFIHSLHNNIISNSILYHSLLHIITSMNIILTFFR